MVACGNGWLLPTILQSANGVKRVSLETGFLLALFLKAKQLKEWEAGAWESCSQGSEMPGQKRHGRGRKRIIKKVT